VFHAPPADGPRTRTLGDGFGLRHRRRFGNDHRRTVHHDDCSDYTGHDGADDVSDHRAATDNGADDNGADDRTDHTDDRTDHTGDHTGDRADHAGTAGPHHDRTIDGGREGLLRPR
jgi:hypothetical protein